MIDTYPHPRARLSKPSLDRRAKANRRRRFEFIRGPIPMPWLRCAASLPGCALSVGLLLWFKNGVTRGLPVKFGSGLRDRFGIERRAGYRAIAALENAQLVKVDRKPGRCSVITLFQKGPRS